MNGKKKILFIPTIFEHSAKIINKTPSQVAVDRNLMEQAHVESYLLYRPDAVTVGIDVYNIEAEALGCKIKFHEDCSIPGIIEHPFLESYNLDSLYFSLERGRIKLILEAAEGVNKKIGTCTKVSVGISGPFSICAELAGFEKLIMDCISDEETVHAMLERVLEHQINYCDEIIKRGLGITLFESWAAPPLVSPDIYRNYVMPYEKKLINYIKKQGVLNVPLVIGGNTMAIINDMIETGTTLIISDFKTDINYYLEKARENDIFLRGNIDPKLIEKGPVEDIIECLKVMLDKVKGYNKFVVGSGVLPYNTPSENVLAIREYINNYVDCEYGFI
ncbi:MAG TPA: hypothetical protein GXX37_12945 [Clostridiaceae bacterium]|nr:hypothetical protein [Clostridiaceae bacterium]